MFISDRLKLARERRGFTKKELAEASGLTTRTISYYENVVEFEEINSDSVKRIAEALDYPIEFFKGREVNFVSTDAISFRSMSKLSTKKRLAAENAGTLAVELSNWIDSKFNLPKPSIPELDYDATTTDPETAARIVRESWALGELSISNMINLLESKGVRVFSLSEDCVEVDAFSFWQDEKPYILLNTKKTPERSRFDAAHELAHLVLHKHTGRTGRKEELEADRFAAAFLMPRRKVLSQIPSMPSLDYLINVKKHWKVSLSALVKRTSDVGLSSEWHYRQLNILLSRMGYRKNEPNGIKENEREVSSILNKVFTLIRQQGVPRATLLDELGNMPLDELSALTFNNSYFNINVVSSNHRVSKIKRNIPNLRVIK